ncbi:hypothetical protein BACI349Y_50232 [Bacillus sp. 349Y]|nr:hypothetical protein BACI349Y_50232 [Bacillus sp. 349Y]
MARLHAEGAFFHFTPKAPSRGRLGEIVSGKERLKAGRENDTYEYK